MPARGYRVAVVAGDGIGPEVMAEARKAVEAAGARFGFGLDWVDYDLGADRWLATGEALPDAVLKELREVDAILLGAVGRPDVPPGVLDGACWFPRRVRIHCELSLRAGDAAVPVRLRRHHFPLAKGGIPPPSDSRAALTPAQRAFVRSQRLLRVAGPLCDRALDCGAALLASAHERTGLPFAGGTAMVRKQQVATAVRRALVMSAMAAAGVAAPALAQENLGEIVVTGSRIRSANLESTTPVTQVTAADVVTQGVTRIEDLVNQLPQAFASQNVTVSNGATGTATLDLRDLGSPRTLVLIDGRRMPYGGVHGGVRGAPTSTRSRRR